MGRAIQRIRRIDRLLNSRRGNRFMGRATRRCHRMASRFRRKPPMGRCRRDRLDRALLRCRAIQPMASRLLPMPRRSQRRLNRTSRGRSPGELVCLRLLRLRPP